MSYDIDLKVLLVLLMEDIIEMNFNLSHFHLNECDRQLDCWLSCLEGNRVGRDTDVYKANVNRHMKKVRSYKKERSVYKHRIEMLKQAIFEGHKLSEAERYAAPELLQSVVRIAYILRNRPAGAETNEETSGD